MKPTVPSSDAAPGRAAATIPGATDHQPASTSPGWKPNPPIGVGSPAFGPAFPAAGALEDANARRGQALIDAFEAPLRAQRDKE